MWCVRMAIPRDRFFEAMNEVGGWLTAEHIDAPHFSYSRDKSGDIRFQIGFVAAAEADRFAARFAADVIAVSTAA